MGHTPIISGPRPNGLGGTQEVYRFNNNYGASVVRGFGTYGAEQGLYELAVVRFTSSDNTFELNYSTPITDDVIGYLSADDVQELLAKIEALPSLPKGTKPVTP